MTEKQVVREVMSLRGISQQKLAEIAGFKSQSNITGLLNNNDKGIRIDNLLRVLNAMGCDIIVRDNLSNETPLREWVITLPLTPIPTNSKEATADEST